MLSIFSRGRRSRDTESGSGLEGRPYSDTPPPAPQTRTVPPPVTSVTDMVNDEAPSRPRGFWASFASGTWRYVRELTVSTYRNPLPPATTLLVVVDLATRADVTLKAVQTAFATNPPDNVDKIQLYRCRPGSAGVNATMVEIFPNGTIVCCPEQLELKVSCPNDDDGGGDNSTAPGANATVWNPHGVSIFAAASTFDNVGGHDLQQPYPTNCSAVSPDLNLIDLLKAALSDGCDICGGDD